jgi:hypothetical protein
MHRENEVDNAGNIKRTRRWLLKSSATLAGAALAAPLVAAAPANAEAPAEAVAKTSAALDSYEMAGGI